MASKAYHLHEVVVAFAGQGISIDRIARALAADKERISHVCERAIERGELQIMPPQSPEDVRTAMLSEVVNLRAALDNAQYLIREMNDERERSRFLGVAGLTGGEAEIVGCLVKHGRASKLRLYHALYGQRENPPEPKIIDVFVCKARKKLADSGATIGTLWGEGYSMSRNSAAILVAMENSRQYRGIHSTPADFVESPPLQPAMDAAQ